MADLDAAFDPKQTFALPTMACGSKHRNALMLEVDCPTTG
jgi:hypothetical protein